MSSPTDRTEKHDDHLAYAPKWARDPNRETSHETPQHNEQSVPKEGLISDQARAHRPLDTASLREARWRWCSPAPAVSGRRKRSWLAPALLGSLHRLSRCPPTGRSSCSAHLTTMAASARLGGSPVAAGTGRRTKTWLGPALRRRPPPQ